MSEVSVFATAGLPTVTDLAASLRGMAAGASGGSVLLKMAKNGDWIFGSDQTTVEPDSEWAINPFSFVHGYIAWGDGEVLGEAMGPIARPKPEVGEAPAAAKRGWEDQVGLSVKCVSGDDEGMEARFSVTSVGGKKAVQAVALAIAAQVEVDPTNPVPVVVLRKGHYQHKSYGRIFTPEFEVVRWVSMEGRAPAQPVDDDAPPKASAAETAEGRRYLSKAADALLASDTPRARRRVV